MIRCVQCDTSFTEEALDAQPVKAQGSCPSCGTHAVPISSDDDVTVKINWHEIRVLGIWAENYIGQVQGEAGAQGQATIRAIARRIRAQFPERSPVTLSGEVAALQAAGYDAQLVRAGETPVPPKRGGIA